MVTTSHNTGKWHPAMKRPFYLSFITAFLAVNAQSSEYLTAYREWEDAPASREEFDHDNDPSVCGIPIVTVKEWEAGRYWEGTRPVLVKNVTDGWAALEHWKKQEMLRRYPDAEATMGEARLVGETGPDEAGSRLVPTTVKEFVTKHMYDPLKYFFDRKISVPKGMLEDCHPFPMPTRAYIENPDMGATYGLSKKKKTRKVEDRELWRDHLAISIGADLQGFGWHHHRAAWNAVIFGAKRWILYDVERVRHNVTRQRRLTRDWDTRELISSPEWIRTLYKHPERQAEIRGWGHDCVQRAGDMMYVPERWLHMVVNIGDTVAIISEIGLGQGQGRPEEDFIDKPPSEDEEEWEYYEYDYEDEGEREGDGVEEYY